ncbi:MAG TPA: hypothetical protein VF169_04600 [Albitalea sp.]|uniref:hypothetical protein n=1 Tax=Piscinibacter sp. TaxID=1903157 RepID=UPI002ED17965
MTSNLHSFVRRACVGGFLVAAALLTGCAQIKLGAPAASVDNIQRAKAAVTTPVAVGEFKAPQGKDAALDAGLDLRSNTVSSPIQGSFAQYLKETLSVELRAAGLLDPASAAVISGALTGSQVDAGASKGLGSLGARFVVMRAGTKVYDKELRVQASWESSFVGAVAIPAAVNEYTALYRKLVAQLLDDPAFRAALKT